MTVDKMISRIEAEIRTLHFGTQPDSLYEPLRYIMTLGGKRLRPLLTLLAYSLYRPNVEKIVPIAAAVEVFHNFTLLHDDIMDNAPLRRGKPTVHEKCNINTAILAGDVMQIKVYEMLLDVERSKLLDVLNAFNRCATNVCEGQQWDMEFEKQLKVSEEQYLDMIRLKTAVLLGFCLELGAILAGAPPRHRTALREFGELIGVGFQLKDDLLDVYGDKKKFGKQHGGDIIANKKTFLLIHAQSIAKGRDKKSLQEWLSRKTFDKREKVEAVTAIYDRLQIRDVTEQKITSYFERAYRRLARIPGIRTEVLNNYTKAIAKREN